LCRPHSGETQEKFDGEKYEYKRRSDRDGERKGRDSRSPGERGRSYTPPERRNSPEYRRKTPSDQGRSNSRERYNPDRIYSNRERTPYREELRDSRRGPRAALPKVPPPSFSGDGEDLQNFITQFYRYARMYDRYGEDAAILIPFSLKGKPENYYNTLVRNGQDVSDPAEVFKKKK
jgi:hypothetical protein